MMVVEVVVVVAVVMRADIPTFVLAEKSVTRKRGRKTISSHVEMLGGRAKFVEKYLFFNKCIFDIPVINYYVIAAAAAVATVVVVVVSVGVSHYLTYNL